MRAMKLLVGVVAMAGSALVLVLVSHRRVDMAEVDVAARLAGPLAYDDPDLLHLISTRFLRPPSTRPYHLVRHNLPSSSQAQRYYLFQGEYGHGFYGDVIRNLFHGVKNGYFVEAGAMDGEFLSNTLLLEQEAGWRGLLVEPNREMFNELVKKHRRAWSSHSCLAIHPFPHSGVLIRYRWIRKNKDAFLEGFAKAHSLLAGVSKGLPVDGSTGGYQSYETVQCLPLASLLLALNATRVDLVSLDVEGTEVGLLRHFPWGRVTVDVWLVEHANPSTREPLATQPGGDQTRLVEAEARVFVGAAATWEQDKNFLDPTFIDIFTERGYEVYKVHTKYGIGNYIFILIDSPVHKRLKKFS